MGYLKNKQIEEFEEEERKWRAVCEIKGFRCSICGETPPKSEREVFFETGMCGYHAHRMEKLKDE